ncbi:hypothetical protein ASC72_21645 [Flavobacterium sp. Root420]|nr:hypothetical protein ASC72_21645 [Flavobacterium sp. Root420]
MEKHVVLKPESAEYLFDTVLAFYYFHEVGHLLAKDLPFDNSISEEVFCDDFSIDLLLSNCKTDELKWRKRGIALGLTLMNVIGMHTGFYDGLDHPFAYDRILNSLEKKIDKDDDELWGWVTALFALHMTENNIEQPTKEFENFNQAVTVYRNILEEHRLSYKK